MAGTGDESAGARRDGYMRASHADREMVIDTLKTAFVQGRLTKEELDVRVGLTFSSRTYRELGLLTADLPVRVIQEQMTAESVAPDPVPLPVNKPLMWGALVATLAGLGAIVGAFPAGLFLLLVAGVFLTLLAAPVAGTLMLDSWRAGRSSGNAPPSAKGHGRAAIEALRDDGQSGGGSTFAEVRQDIRKSPANRAGSSSRSRRPLRAHVAARAS